MGTPKRLQHPNAAKAWRALDRLLPRRLEKHEQADAVTLLETVGAKVYKLGTTRKRGDYQGTMQTPGVSDLLAFLPVAIEIEPYPLKMVWFEMKRAKNGRLSEPQEEFRRMCQLAGCEHVVARGVADVVEYLTAGGWLRNRLAPR